MGCINDCLSMMQMGQKKSPAYCLSMIDLGSPSIKFLTGLSVAKYNPVINGVEERAALILSVK